MRPAETNVLYRFSELKWLDRSLRLGEFRLVSASYINGIEGDTERQDNEIDRSFDVDSSRAKVIHASTGKEIRLKSSINVSCSTETDYYMLCFSTQKSKINYDLFLGSEGYIAIQDRVEFTKRLNHAVAEVLPNWQALNAGIAYGMKQHEYGALFRKPNEYMFQFEWRYVWLPPTRERNLENLVVSIGNIEDISHVQEKG